MIKLWQEATYHQKLYCLLFIGLILRLGWAITIPIIPVSDSVIYATTAKNLLEFGVYGIDPNQPFSYWPVGTAAIYAAGYKLFGLNPWTVVFLNITASLGLIYSSATLAKRWLNERVSLLTAAFLTFWPSLIFYVTLFASEIFFSLFVNLSLLAWRIDSRHWVARTMLAGLMLSIATYIRPITLLLPFVLAGIELVQTKRYKRPTLAFLITIAVLTVTIAPWSVRNSRLHNGFVLISTNGAPNLWMGNNPNSTGTYMPLPMSVKNLNERVRAQLLGAKARQFIQEHPGRTAILYLRKLVHTHLSETIAVHWNAPGLATTLGKNALAPLKWISQLYWMTLLILGLYGALIISKQVLIGRFSDLARQQPSIIPLVLWAYFAILHAAIVSQDRYHFPSIPFIAILSSLGVKPTFRLLQHVLHLTISNKVS